MSFTARAIDLALRAARLDRVDEQIAAAAHDPTVEYRAIARSRKMDKFDPPRRLLRRRSHAVQRVDGTPLHVIRHDDTPGVRVLLYLHGGGYFCGPMMLHWRSAPALAADLGADVALPIYPKAPEHTADDTLAAVVAVYDRLLDRYGAENIVVGGDSAGGGLTMSLLGIARDTGRPQPRAALLVSPWLDLSLADPAAAGLSDRDHMLTVTGARYAADWYRGDRPVDDPSISPLYADTAGLAPLHLWVGTDEILLPDCRTFIGKARAAGHRATIHEISRGQHVSALWPTVEGRCARAQMVALVDWPS